MAKKKRAISTFLACFTVYTVLIGESSHLSRKGTGTQLAISTLPLVMFGFGLWMLLEEFRQIKTFTRDGLQYFANHTWGLRYYWRSHWNKVDLASCLMLLVIIPIAHALALTHSAFDDWLSVVVAAEAILASIKASPVLSFTLRVLRSSLDRCGTLLSHFEIPERWC